MVDIVCTLHMRMLRLEAKSLSVAGHRANNGRDALVSKPMFLFAELPLWSVYSEHSLIGSIQGP